MPSGIRTIALNRKQMYFYYETRDTQGEAMTPGFGQPWNLTAFDKDLFYQVDIIGPWADSTADWTRSNVSIFIEHEKNLLHQLPIGFDNVGSTFGWVIPKDEMKVTITLLVGGSKKTFGLGLTRKISDEEMARIKTETMPGMRVRWQGQGYNRSVELDLNFRNRNRNFIRLVNIVHFSGSKQDVWQAVIKAKRIAIDDFAKYCPYMYMFKDTIVGTKMDLVETLLGVETRDEILSNVSSSSLEVAAEMYTHLVYCSSTKRIQSWMSLYPKLFREHSAKTILLILSRIASKVTTLDNQFEYLMAKRMLTKVWEVLELPDISTDLDYKDVLTQTKMNHPVHLLNAKGNLSPSALIPFCDFGGSLSGLGRKIPEFDFPVCDGFKAVLLKGRTCYEIDLSLIQSDMDMNEELFKIGLTLLLDYNEDRWISADNNTVVSEEVKGNLGKAILDFEELDKAYIHIDTISMSGIEVTVQSSFLFQRR